MPGTYSLFVMSVCLAACSCVASALDLPVDPRGPIAYPGMQVDCSAEGVQTHGYAFVDNCRKPGPWTARWIWLPADAQVPCAVCLRKDVTLDQAPKAVTAWISADAKYRLWINGRLVSRGPVDIGKDYAGGSTGKWFYDARDLTPFFHRGENVVAAQVFSNWPVGPTVSRGHGGFLFEAAVTQGDDSTRTITSDASWRGIPASQFPNAGTYDEGKVPCGWRQSGFNDTTWSACVLTNDLWSTLIPSEIPPRMEKRYPVLRIDGLNGGVKLQADGSVHVSANGSFNVVFDKALSAFPSLKTIGGQGARMTIRATCGADVILGAGEQPYEFPYMSEIAPAYSVTLQNVTTPFDISDIGADFISQPVEYRGRFSCSDDKLNAIWKAARWAVQICMQTHHLDSPNHQEPISDPGDYVIESMVAHYAFHQPWLARQDIRKFSWLLTDEHFRNFHTSYSLAWLQMLMDYYDFTGDRTLVEEMAPTLHGLLDTYQTWIGKNGIICEAPNYMFMDWVEIAGIPCHHPPAVIGQGYITALYYHGLDQGMRVAQMMGDTKRAQKYAAVRSALRVAFQRELWVADKGLYRDGKPFQTSVKPYGWLPADTKIETFSPHVNILAVLYDLAPTEDQVAIMTRVLGERKLNTQPWFMHWVFQAIDHAGLFDTYATAQMHRWHIVPQTQTFTEMWNGGDLSHGWCSTPLVQMSSRILGVTPRAPGFTRIAIRPELCDLTWAKGLVPTPMGDVAVDWAVGENALHMSVEVPAGSIADLTVPTDLFETPHITIDDHQVDGPNPTVPLQPGAHHCLITGKLKTPARPPAAASGTQPQSTADDTDAYESEVSKNDLVHAGPGCRLVSVQEHCSHDGGGTDTSALFNGTTRNGSGGQETLDDGATFRGYGQGDFLVLHLDPVASASGYDLTRIVSFAGHADARSSQGYTLSFAFADAPDHFVTFAHCTLACAAGGSIVRYFEKGNAPLDNHAGCTATHVVAVRFDFANGSSGFNCYREFCMAGTPSK